MSSNHKKCMVLGWGAGFGVGRNCDGMENKSQVRVAAQQANERREKKKKTSSVPLKSGARREHRGQEEQWVRSC